MDFRPAITFAILACIATSCRPTTRSVDFHCTTDADCSDGRFCDAGWCVTESTSCDVDTTCRSPGICQTDVGASCADSVCTYPQAAQGSACDDDDPCSESSCDASGQCIGGIACWTPPTDYCITPDVMREYGDIGTCGATGCIYSFSDQPCPACPGCAAACALDIDGDQQDDIVADGTINPINGCELCDSTAATNAWTPFPCQQGAPVDPCLEPSGTCNPDIGGGTCSGPSCCNYVPLYSGTGTPPECPLGNEDTDSDGMLDGGETWTGSCTNTGACGGCTLASQCSDSDPCSVDDCVDGVCENIFPAAVGTTCTVTTTDDGLCTAEGDTAVCKLADGQPCGDPAACSSDFCECADAACAGRACSAVVCDCTFNTDGNATCDGLLDDGTQDAPFCDFLSACYAGACSQLPGSDCLLDGDCGVGTCECADAPCATRQCSPVACDCEYNSNGDSTCDANLADGARDPGFCEGAFNCIGGICIDSTTGLNGDTCNSGADCSSGICDCSNAGCTERVCGAVSCDCMYNANGDATCDANLTDNVLDPPFCDGNDVCEAGVCVLRLANGLTCNDNTECASGACVCRNSGCSWNRRCAPLACDCGYDSDSDGVCDGNLVDGSVDPPACTGGDACLAGACQTGLFANAVPCTTNGDCASGQCECADAQCSTGVCSAVDCPTCTTNPNGDSWCGADVDDGFDDFDDSCGPTLTCNGNGNCNTPDGGTCSRDSRCESNICNCGNATCSTRICGSLQCDCTYDAAGDGTCEAQINDGLQDVFNCDGTNEGCFGGTCQTPTGIADGSACGTNSHCLNGQCECVDGPCTSRLCSAVDCPCGFNATGDATCDGNINRWGVDPADSCGGETCNGQGACHFPEEAACSFDWECEDDKCENNKCND